MGVKGVGSALFAAILLLIAGTLNVIYGIGAVSNSNFFESNNVYVFSNLDTWGWVTIILGVIEILAGMSLLAGGAFGRVFGMFAASLAAIGSLLAISGAHPWWAIASFAISIIVLHGLAVYGEPKTA
jgi:hypothetical protein